MVASSCLAPWAASLSRTLRRLPRGSARDVGVCRPLLARPRRSLAAPPEAGAGSDGDSDGGGGVDTHGSEAAIISTTSADSERPRKAGHGKNKRDLDEALGEIRTILVDPGRLVRAVAGGAARGASPAWRKVEMRPVALKRGGVKLQVVKYDQRQAFTSNHAYPNVTTGGQTGRRRVGRSGGGGGGGDGGEKKASVLSADEAADEALRGGFGTWRVETTAEVLQLRVTKSGEAMVHRTRQLLGNARGGDGGGGASNVQSHDRVKSRLLEPSDPFLVHVGVSTADGSSIKASRRDKYKQVEEFLRLVDLAVGDAQTGSHMRRPTNDAPMRLVDLGCGNAYLTFGAYALLAAKRGTPLEVVGVDVKRQARETNTRVAQELGWGSACTFVEGTIADAPLEFPTSRPGQPETSAAGGGKEGEAPEVDIVLALHACDTATDEALVRAVRWCAPLTLVSPCCHHDLQVRMRNAKRQAYPPLTRHGILRERLGDIITDAFRAHILRLLGYRVDVVEWIGGEHTPRNTMIRAIRTGSPADGRLWEEYDAMCADWGVTPWLAEALEPELASARAALGGGDGVDA